MSLFDRFRKPELAVAVCEKEASTAPNELRVVVGGKYPSMFGHSPYTLKVERLVEFMGGVTVQYTVVERPNIHHSDTLDTFCRGIARRVAYENNTLDSVDVTEYFRKYSLTSGNQA